MGDSRAERVDRLAALFVLGTLRGGARRRFARLAQTDLAISSAVADWEALLIPLAYNIPPVIPPEDVWRKVLASIRPAPDVRAVPSSRPDSWITRNASKAKSWWTSLRFWRAIALSSFGGVVVLANVHLMKHDELFPQTYIAVLADESASPMIIVSGKEVSHFITVKIAVAQAIPPGRSLQLWALPTQGTPRPLGLLPSAGIVQLPVHPGVRDALASVQQIAVSVEPEGGSSTGSPTGPVLYRGAVVQTR